MKSTRAPESSRRVAMAPEPKPAKIGTTVSAGLEAAVKNGENLRDHGHGTGPRGRRRASPMAASAIGHAIGFGRNSAKVTVRVAPLSPSQMQATRSGVGPAVQAIVRDIEPAADEPLGPLGAAAGIEHLVVGLEPFDAHFAHDLIPESLGIFTREAQKRLAVRKPEALHEAPDVGPLDELAGGLPDHANNSVTRAALR